MIKDNDNLNQNEETMENESVTVIETPDLTPSENSSVSTEIVNYLDPKILNVKKFNADNIIDSDDSLENNNEDLSLYSNDDFSNISEKQLVNGVIVAVNDKEVLVDIGFKSEGVIDKNEFKSIPHVGEEV